MTDDQPEGAINCSCPRVYSDVVNPKWNDTLVHSFQKVRVMNKSQSKKKSKPQSWDVNVEFPDLNGDLWAVSVDFKTVKGRIVPVALLIKPLRGVIELKTEILHELSIQKIVKPWIIREQKALAQRHASIQMKAHSGRQHSNDELQSVADVYQSAYKKSLPVQQTVAEILGIPLSTATKRIMAARRQGLIPRTMNRRKSA